jgi:hypothetical protein
MCRLRFSPDIYISNTAFFMKKSELKQIIRECIKAVKVKKLLKEIFHKEQSLEVEFEGNTFQVEGDYVAEVQVQKGGFDYPGHGGGFKSETEPEIIKSGFVASEVSQKVSGALQPVTDAAFIAKLQKYINDKFDFSDEEQEAIQDALDKQ